MANKSIQELQSKQSILSTDITVVADPTSGDLMKMSLLSIIDLVPTASLVWGNITGIINNQTDLSASLNNILVSANTYTSASISTVNNSISTVSGSVSILSNNSVKRVSLKSDLSTKGLADSRAYFVDETKYTYYLSDIDYTSGSATNAAVTSSDSPVKYWIPSNFVFNNTNSGTVQKTSPIRFGSMQSITDQTIVFQGAAAVQITDRGTSVFGNPQYLGMSCPDGGTANGYSFGIFGSSAGKGYPKMYFNSNYGENGNYDIGCQIHTMMSEPAISSTINSALSLKPRKRTSTTQFWNDVNLTDSKTFLLNIERLTGGITSINSNNLGWGVRLSGDVHIRGSIYKKISVISGDITPTLDFVGYKYIGTGSNSINLPSPTDADNLNRTIELYNYGTNPLTFSSVVYLDGINSINTLPSSFPDNRITIACDGTNWYKTL